MRRAVVWTTCLATVLFVLDASTGFAQRIAAGFYGSAPPRFANGNSFQGSFTFCRAMFNSNRREKRGWSTDYPLAEINFSIRLAELTKARVARQPGGDRQPEYVVVRLTDPELSQCPYLLMEDAGTMHLDEREVNGLRDYLLKGEFIFVSDYWGEPARDQFDEEIGRVLPPHDYPIVDLPIEHAIFQGHFPMHELPQMPSIQSWRRSGGNTDRGVSDAPDARAIADRHGRLMVVMIHNSDIPDGWEREGEEREYFYRFSPDAYTVGINVVLYAMTH